MINVIKKKSTPIRIMETLKHIKVGRTVPEIAKRVNASKSTTRRSVNRLINRGKLGRVDDKRHCTTTNKNLLGYKLA